MMVQKSIGLTNEKKKVKALCCTHATRVTCRKFTDIDLFFTVGRNQTKRDAREEFRIAKCSESIGIIWRALTNNANAFINDLRPRV